MIKIVENNTEITYSKKIANAFNNYFVNVGNILSNLIPNVQNSPLDYLKDQIIVFIFSLFILQVKLRQKSPN